MSRLLAYSAFSAALFSLAVRPWGLGYLAVLAVVPLARVLNSERKPWRGALAASIAWLGLGIPALEGIGVRLWWGFPVLLVIMVVGWAAAGLLVVWTGKHLPGRLSYLTIPLFFTAAEFLGSQRWLFGSTANPLLALPLAGTPFRYLAAWSGASAIVLAVLLVGTAANSLIDRVSSPPAWVLGAVVVSLLLPVPGVPGTSSSQGIRVAAVQGAQPGLKRLLARYDESTSESLMGTYATLIRSAVDDGAELIVMSEGWLPMLPGAEMPEHVRRALSIAPATIVGGPESAGGKRFNSAYIWDGTELESVYQKQTLVPVIESHYTAGASAYPRAIQGVFTGLGICLDSLNTGLVRGAVQQGAELLVLITDDSFAGYTSTPYFHLASAAIRAAEVGRSVVFANEWGPSAIFGPRGDELVSISLGEKGAISAQVPVMHGTTPYVALGDWLGMLALASASSILLLRSVQAIASRRKRLVESGSGVDGRGAMPVADPTDVKEPAWN